jgi:hypothetical protein
MNTKAKEASKFSTRLTEVANDLSSRGEALAEQVLKSRTHARKSIRLWERGAREIVHRNPGKAMLGAFVIGFLIAKVGRYV